MTKPAYDLELTWPLPQTAAEVFAAWTEAAQLAQWWQFPGYSTPTERVIVDARVGGTWSVTAVSDADASEIPFAGEIREIDQDSRLVIALIDEPSSAAETPSQMVVILRETPDGSELNSTTSDSEAPKAWKNFAADTPDSSFPA
jgi:uncharacterized protein YndB with AHSA1/START domain